MKHTIINILIFLIAFAGTIFLMRYMKSKWMLEGAVIGYNYFKTEYSECILKCGENYEKIKLH